MIVCVDISDSFCWFDEEVTGCNIWKCVAMNKGHGGDRVASFMVTVSIYVVYHWMDMVLCHNCLYLQVVNDDKLFVGGGK